MNGCTGCLVKLVILALIATVLQWMGCGPDPKVKETSSAQVQGD